MHVVRRKDQYVAELIEHFDEKFKGFDGDVKMCWDNLLPEESETLNMELTRIHGNDPASVRYYLENYHVIATKGDEYGPPELMTLYPFWESQEILWEDVELSWEEKIPIKWILLKARQIGWSTMVQAMIFYRTVFNELTNSLVIADERIRSSHIFDMSRLAYDCLPWWLRPEIQYEVHGEFMRFDRRDKRERLERPGLRSNFFVDSANKPTGSSRGFTLQNGHLTDPDPRSVSRCDQRQPSFHLGHGRNRRRCRGSLSPLVPTSRAGSLELEAEVLPLVEAEGIQQAF
jgi:hypothetical protein